MNDQLRTIEVLAPVGNREMFDAAVAAGADAVYMAGKHFGARAYAENFDVQAMQDVIDLAHWHGMQVHMTVNTLIKDDELDAAIAQVEELYCAGADAIIIQDLGLIAAVHKRMPKLALHGSTQLSVTSVEGAKQMQSLGLTRIVLGREVSIEEARRIVEETDLEVEAFVHGSLCVSVSGQCYLSSFAGGRSGNRGRCAQPCRKTYDIVDASGKAIGKTDTYLSPRDLATIDHVDALVDAGIHSFKIEGRMKKPEYVFATVRAYRAAVDHKLTESLKRDMQLTTNRPFTSGFLFHDFGIDYVYRTKDLSGERIGKITTEGRRPLLRLEKALSSGDIVSVESDKHRFSLTATADFAAGDVWDLRKYPDLKDGSVCMRIHSEHAREALTQTLQAQNAKSSTALRDTSMDGQSPLYMHATVQTGEPLRLVGESRGMSIEVTGEVVEAAKNAAMAETDLRKSFEKVGDTPFYLKHLTVDTDGASFVRKASLNALRREVTDRLFREYVEAFHRVLPKSDAFDATINTQQSSTAGNHENSWKLTLETDRLPHAFHASSIAGVARVFLREGADVKAWFDYRQESGASFAIYFQGSRLLDAIGYRDLSQRLEMLSEKGMDFDGFAIQSVDDWHFFQEYIANHTSVNVQNNGQKLSGTHTMNVANHLTFLALAKRNAETIGISQELNSDELAHMANLRRAASNQTASNQTADNQTVSNHTADKQAACNREDAADVGNTSIVETNAEIIVYGRLAGMLLKHCPAAAIKGCHDDSQCATCRFRKGHRLVDVFGAREFIRVNGETEVLLPEPIDIRGRTDLLDETDMQYLRIVDHGEEALDAVLSDWNGYLKTMTWPQRRDGLDGQRGGDSADRMDAGSVDRGNPGRVGGNDSRNVGKTNAKAKKGARAYLGHFAEGIE